MASVLTISPSSRSARSSERPVLPAAVAPTTATMGRWVGCSVGRSGTRVSLAATGRPESGIGCAHVAAARGRVRRGLRSRPRRAALLVPRYANARRGPPDRADPPCARRRPARLRGAAGLDPAFPPGGGLGDAAGLRTAGDLLRDPSGAGRHGTGLASVRVTDRFLLVPAAYVFLL